MPPEQLKLALEEALDLTKSLRPASRAIAVVVKAFEAPEGAPLSDLAKKVGVLERVAEKETLRQAVPSLGGAVTEAKQTLGDITRLRGDTLKRRESIATLAKDRGMPFKHADRCDWLGPFRLDHLESATIVKLGHLTVARVKTPSPLQAIRVVEKLAAQLEKDARAGFEAFAEAAERRQRDLSASEPVRWKELVEYVIPDAKERRRKALVLLYRLALLIFGDAPGGWEFVRVPPPLAEQRDAIEVPDLRHAGDSERVVRGRLRKR